jgi:biopolymer transport protein ExbD
MLYHHGNQDKPGEQTMSMTYAAPTEPMGELNTTPLIDVLLVLLILFIITIPAATHSVEIELPGDKTEARLDPVINKVLITADNRVLWNAAPVSQGELAGLITLAGRLPIEPALQLEADAAAPYDLAAKTVRTIKLAGAETFGMVGTERFAEFGKAD